MRERTVLLDRIDDMDVSDRAIVTWLLRHQPEMLSAALDCTPSA